MVFYVSTTPGTIGGISPKSALTRPAYCGEAHPVSLQRYSCPLTISASCKVKSLVHHYLRSFSSQIGFVVYWWDGVDSTQKHVDGWWPRPWRLPKRRSQGLGSRYLVTLAFRTRVVSLGIVRASTNCKRGFAWIKQAFTPERV